MVKIVVEVGRQGNGTTFRLSPKTRVMLQAKGIPLPETSTLFVPSETRRAFEEIYGPIKEHIVLILTGLNEAQLRRFGYSFVDPVDSVVLLESDAA